jgi:hypothetical protein
MIQLEEENVYKLEITFLDILVLAPENVQMYFSNLSREGKDEFVQANFKSAQNGCNFGLSDPVADVMKVIADDLKIP